MLFRVMTTCWRSSIFKGRQFLLRRNLCDFLKEDEGDSNGSPSFYTNRIVSPTGAKGRGRWRWRRCPSFVVELDDGAEDGRVLVGGVGIEVHHHAALIFLVTPICRVCAQLKDTPDPFVFAKGNTVSGFDVEVGTELARVNGGVAFCFELGDGNGADKGNVSAVVIAALGLE